MIVSLSASCKGGFGIKNDEEPIIAEVGNKKLLRSDIANLVVGSKSPDDSIRILKGLVNNWVKDQIMIAEAEKSLPRDINLNKMIDDYRSSLLLYNYETRLAGDLLDTVITSQQKQEYYDANSKEFVLSEDIAKYIVTKIPSNTKGLDDFYKDWKKGDSGKVSVFCKQHAEYSDLDAERWKTVSELTSVLPKNFSFNGILSKKESLRKKEKDSEYFIKVLDYGSAKDKPPFDYIQGKIEKVLLNERKKSLIKKEKQRLFDKLSSSSNVKIYVK